MCVSDAGLGGATGARRPLRAPCPPLPEQPWGAGKLGGRSSPGPATAISVLAHWGAPSLCFHPLWPGAWLESPSTTCAPHEGSQKRGSATHDGGETSGPLPVLGMKKSNWPPCPVGIGACEMLWPWSLLQMGVQRDFSVHCGVA